MPASLNDPLRGGTAFFNPAPGVILSGANPVCVDRGLTGNAVTMAYCASLPANTAGSTGAQTIADTFPLASPAVTTGSAYNIQFNPDGTAWAGTGFGQRGATYRFNSGPLNGFPWKKTAAGNIGFNNINLYLILPLTRYNAFARGNYEINDWVGIFGQALFSHVNTYTRNEPGPITNGWDVFLPYGTGTYVGSQASSQRPAIGPATRARSSSTA
jgi:hypothetical protein